MVKTSKIVICGMKGIGKTSMIEHLIYGNIEKQDIHPTIEDIYIATVETDRGTRENLRFYDFEGFSLSDSLSENSDLSIPKLYHSIADAFVLIYSVSNKQSFECIDILRRDIEKNKEKKDLTIIVIGLKLKIDEKREVDSSFVGSWAIREKLKYFEVVLTDRKSLFVPFIHLASKLSAPQSKSSFTPLVGMVTRKNAN